jgi:hypothetical protein
VRNTKSVDFLYNIEQKRPMNPIKLSISVMAHPSRTRFFPYLQDKLRLPLSQFSIDKKNNLLENSKAAWMMYDPEADFHCVIQDDAIICENFREKAVVFISEQEDRRIKESRPAQGYNFFLKQDNRKSPLWPKDGAYTDNVTRAGIAICLPVAHIKPMLLEFDRQHSRHDDDRISEYCKRIGMKILFPVPSLIDHRIDGISLANNPVGLAAWKSYGCELVTIPKIIHQLWVGNQPLPVKWMGTWKEAHPDWEYRLWENDEVFGTKWINQAHVDYFKDRQMWPGVSDICTYEILFNHGGFMIGADAVCLAPIDELFYNDYDAYSVYENEKIRSGLISPLHASVKGGVFAAELIEGLKQKAPGGVPWKTVGNQFMGEMYRKTNANVKIFPSHYFIPEHFMGMKYDGTDKIYARQMWGSTTRCYNQGVSEMDMIVSDIVDSLKGKKFIMLGAGQMEYLVKNLAAVMDVPGDAVELGCNVGMTSSYLQRLLIRSKSDKKLHVYDSFEGLPEKTAEDGATPCEKGASTVSEDMFKQTFKDAGIPLPVINKGFFGDIPDDKYPDKICFAFLDGDFYSSIMDSFKKIYHKTQSGGVIFVHDYEYAPFPGVKKACDDFLADKPEKDTQEINGIGIIRKL